MDRDVYAVETAIEATHWWFVGRRELLAREILRLGLRPHDRIIDIGSSTGSGLRMLQQLEFTNYCGVDTSEDAKRYCVAKGLGDVEIADANALPFEDGSVKLAIASDVLEHLDDDVGAIREVHRVLSPGGAVLITVPTFACLWGLQDEVAHHKRRYRLRPLLSLLTDNGLVPTRYYYFNWALFAPIWVARQVIAAAGIRLSSEAEVHSDLINRILVPVFRLDCLLAPHLRMPFGVSALAVARRPR